MSKTSQTFLGLAVAALMSCTSASADPSADPGVGAAACPDAATPKPPPYPTAALADYVLGCLVANGQTPDTLRKCACSIDFIAAAMPYEDYERIETLMRLQQMEGAGRNAVYKGATWAKDAVGHFKEIQAESTLRCF